MLSDLLNSEFMRGIFNDVVRGILYSAGTFLMAHGVLKSAQMNDFLGSGFFIAGLAWQWWENHNQGVQKKALIAAAVPPASTGSNSVPNGVVPLQ